METKVCDECGAEFGKNRWDTGETWAARVVCSRKCAGTRAQRAWTQRLKSEKEQARKACAQCGEDYGPRRSLKEWRASKYCSIKCLHAAQRIEVEPTKPCVGCGKELHRREGEKASDWCRRRYCTRRCAALTRHRMEHERPVEDLGIPEFETEAERHACMQGVWIGWSRCLSSGVSKTSLGNALMGLVAQALSRVSLPDSDKRSIYEAAGRVPLPDASKRPRRPLESKFSPPRRDQQ